MARNGSGTYSLVSGNPVVTGSTISSTTMNNTLSDIATALTGSVAADGQTPITGALSSSSTFSGTRLTASQGIAVGAATAGLGGIAFPATAVGVADANTLDDYEEGTFTPTLQGATTTTYTLQQAAYTKIGRVVYFNCEIIINSVGDGSVRTIVLGSLPNSAADYTNSVSVSYFVGIASSVTWLGGTIDAGSNTVTLRSLSAAATGINASPTIFQNSTRVVLSGFYFV